MRKTFMRKKNIEYVKESHNELAREHIGDAIGLGAGVADHLVENLHAGVAGDFIGIFTEISTNIGKIDRTPNPKFIENQIASATTPSPAVKEYFSNRKRKKIAGSVFTFVGSAVGVAFQVNVANLGKHGRALVKTTAHLARLNTLAQDFRQSEYLTGLLNELIKLKKIKAASQGSQLIVDIVAAAPGGSIIEGGVNTATSLSLNSILRNEAETIEKVAVELHWRAFQESQLTTETGSGPATRMVREIFGQAIRLEKERLDSPSELQEEHSKADKYIKEPAGWLVIIDKLTLI